MVDNITKYIVTAKITTHPERGFRYFTVPSYICDYLHYRYAKKKHSVKLVVVNEENFKEISVIEPFEIWFECLIDMESKWVRSNYQFGNYRLVYYKFRPEPSNNIAANPNQNAIELKLLERLGYEWYNILRPHLIGNIGKTLTKLKARRKSINVTPEQKDVFNTFSVNSPSKTRLVIVGKHENNTTGIPFTYEGNEKPKFFQLLENRIISETPHSSIDGNLKVLLNRDVLLLNTALTSDKGNRQFHIDLWDHLIKLVFTSFAVKEYPVVFILIGKEAHKYRELIPEQHKVLKVEHFDDAIAENREWNNKNCFSKITTHLSLTQNYKMTWGN